MPRSLGSPLFTFRPLTTMHTQQLPGADYAIHLAAELDPGHDALTLADQLGEAGLTATQIKAVEALVFRESERLSFHRAGEVLRRVFCHISSYNSACAGLCYALGLSGGRSISDLAAELGFSKQAVGNMTARLVPLLGPLAVSKAGRHELARPTEPGTWLTLAEAAKVSGRAAQAIQAAAQVGELRRVMVGNRGFIGEADLLAWDERSQLTKATEVWKQSQHPQKMNSNTERPRSLSLSA